MASISACHADDPGSIPGRGEVGTIAHVSGAASPRSMVNTELACMCTRIQNPHGGCICAFGAWHAHPHGKLATAKSSSVGFPTVNAASSAGGIRRSLRAGMRVTLGRWLPVFRALAVWICRWLLTPSVCPNQFAGSKTSTHAEPQIFREAFKSVVV